METMLAKITLTILTAAIEEALQEPTVVQGVQLEINVTVTAVEVQGDIETHLNLTKKLGYQPTIELLLKCLVARMTSAKFKKTHKVWNCVGGVLIMPAAMTPEDSNDLASRIVMWNPGTLQLEDITKAPAVAMEEDAPAEEEAFSVQIQKALANLGEDSSQVLLDWIWRFSMEKSI